MSLRAIGRAGAAALVLAACEESVCDCLPVIATAIVYGQLRTDSGAPVVGHDLRVTADERAGNCPALFAAASGSSDALGNYRMEVQATAEGVAACLTLSGRRIPTVAHQPLDTFPRVDARFSVPFDSVRLDVIFPSLPPPPAAHP